MKEKYSFDEIEIGMEMGPLELDVSPETVEEHRNWTRWEVGGDDNPANALPGIFLINHVRLLTATLGGAGSRIWAKSQHEFFNPIRVGSKLVKRGKIVDKYLKRGKQYLIYEIETRDQDDRLIMRSRETSFFGENREGSQVEHESR
jgi:hypothetical protein